ncbi:MAG: replicative DNA helicase [Bacteroidales bacterium]|nr:replicative DNA helicase [Bacteroidales bacterium]
MEENSGRKKQKSNPSEAVQDINLRGKVQPQARDYEEALLGAMMLEQNAAGQVIGRLKAEMFYQNAHKEIFKAMVAIYNEHNPIDLLSVTAQLRKNKMLSAVGGAYYLTSLTDNVSSSAYIGYYADVVIEKYMLRELISVSTDTVTQAYENVKDATTILDEAEAGLFNIMEQQRSQNEKTMQELAVQFMESLQEARSKGSDIQGIPSGFKGLDDVTGGWHGSNLIIIAARPGVGKTAFVLSMARNIAVENKNPVAFFSLEMSAAELVMRLASGESKIDQEKLKKARLTDTEMKHLQEALGVLSEAPLIIDDTPGLNIFDLRSKCRRLKQQYNVQCIIIDYLQLMQAASKEGRSNREQEVANISRSLKSLAKELDVPVIALSQLSRNVEQRAGGDKIPQLSDLRESGSIEQDADIVMFIYRPEAHHLETFPNGDPARGLAKLIIAKNRHGRQEEITVRFIGEHAKFTDMEYMPNDTLDVQKITLPSKGNNDNSEDIPF